MFNSGDIVSVYLPLKIEGSYAYKVPEGVLLQEGDIVLVPLRNKEVMGIIYSKEDQLDYPIEKIKPIIKKINNIPPLNLELITFLKKLSTYYMNNFGNVLKMAMNITGFNFDTYNQIISLGEFDVTTLKMTKQRKQVLEVLRNQEKYEKKELANKAQVSVSVIDNMLKENALSITNEYVISKLQESLKYTPVDLSLKQKEISMQIINNIKKSEFSVSVLYGVPGSGKTEIYFEAINQVIKANKQVLIMLPEIALSTQIVDRFNERFGVPAYVWHSDISKSQKQNAWISASNNQLKVAIGARSSLFLPFSNLGLIVVDEEHDQSFKQEEGVVYNARDMAVLRAKFLNIPILLGSATPSLETINNVNKQKYQLFTIDSRFNEHDIPEIKIIDMNQNKPSKGKFLSQIFVDKIKSIIAKKEQALLFINKRGYASTIFCTSCKEKLLCQNCSVTLTYHQKLNKYLCHYCGYSAMVSNICNSCNSVDTLIELGAGVERVHEEIKEYFPEARIAIISSDTINTNNKAKKIVEDILADKYDILIGTQIIAKGYHFPKLTFVGITDGDYSYNLDLKANEKTWQMLYQVAGRSGRDELKGEVWLQTYAPDDSLIKSLAKQDYNAFINQEMLERKEYEMPPFGKIAGIIVSSKDKKILNDFCSYLSQIKPQGENFEILGPAEAPIFFLRSWYRKRFLIKVKEKVIIQKVIKNWLQAILIPNKIKLQIDIDPLSFY